MTDDTPRDLQTDRVPSGREIHAYHELIRIQRATGRRITAQQAWPHVRYFTRLRAYSGVEQTSGEANADRSLAPQKAVMRTVRGIEKRVTAWLADAEYLEQQRALIANEAMVTALECVAHGGAYDIDPKLLREKGRIALELIRACGLSKEQKTTRNEVNVKFGAAVPDDDVAASVAARRQLREDRLGGRLAGLDAAKN